MLFNTLWCIIHAVLLSRYNIINVVVYVKCSDGVPQASCSIQEPELEIINDFLKSVELRCVCLCICKNLVISTYVSCVFMYI